TSFARLVAGDANNCRDVYVFDRQTNRVTLESEPPDHCEADRDAGRPRLSGDGRMLVYEFRDVVVLRDRVANTWRKLGGGRDPAINADGGFVGFVSTGDAQGGPPPCAAGGGGGRVMD